MNKKYVITMTIWLMGLQKTGVEQNRANGKILVDKRMKLNLT